MPVILSLIAQLPDLRVVVEHFDGTFANCAPGEADGPLFSGVEMPLTEWVGGTAGVLEQTARAVVKKVNPRTELRMSYTHEK